MVVKISSGLGNQMFQFAFLYLLEQVTGENSKIDISFYDDNIVHNGYEIERIFNISREKTVCDMPFWCHPYVVKLMRRLRIPYLKGNNLFYELHMGYYFKKFTNICSHCYVGYWQNKEYYTSIRKQLAVFFAFPEIKEENNKAILQEIEGCESVSIHIRRGDYLQFSKYVSLCDNGYYERAIGYINKTFHNPVFFVFSDDMNWCKNYLSRFNNRFVFIDWNQGDLSYRDMQLMKSCKANIIANSSFSWWGAFLNRAALLTICPEHFFCNINKKYDSGLILDEWIPM